MKRFLMALSLFILVAPASVSADGGGVELTLFGGYRTDGDLDPDDPFDDIFASELTVEGADVFGASLGVPLSDHWVLDFYYSFQDTELVEQGGLFEPDLDVSDIDVTYIQAGVQYQWTPGQLRPYIVAGLGAAILDPSASFLDEETRLSASVGGGLKVFLADHFGIRIESRALWADIDDEDFDDRCCRRRDRSSDDLFQLEATAGIIIKF